MILFFKTPQGSVIATDVDHQLDQQEVSELCWLYGDATLLSESELEGIFVGPRREMVTPWATNAVEITQNMGLKGIQRIEEYFPIDNSRLTIDNEVPEDAYDPMLQRVYKGLDQRVFTVRIEPEPIKLVENLEEYNEQEGLALSPEEIEYLHKIEKQNGRPLTDYETEWRRVMEKPLKTAAFNKKLADRFAFSGPEWMVTFCMGVLGKRRMNNLIRCKRIFP